MFLQPKKPMHYFFACTSIFYLNYGSCSKFCSLCGNYFSAKERNYAEGTNQYLERFLFPVFRGFSLTKHGACISFLFFQ